MLSEKTIRDLAVKWQTTPLNVVREYLQHLFLSYLYQSPLSENLAFKGGTALRLLFRSPRFSEDLDFTGGLKPFHLKELLSQTVQKVALEAGEIKEKESKPTSGGYLALYEGTLYGEKVRVEVNVSFRTKPKPEPILTTTPLVPSYQCLALPINQLVREKCEALLFRKKPRDYFDLYFLLRERLGVSQIIPLKKRLQESLKKFDNKSAAQELKLFLPTSLHQIVSRLSQALASELERL